MEKMKVHLYNYESFIKYISTILHKLYPEEMFDINGIDNKSYSKCDCGKGVKYEFKKMDIIVCEKCYDNTI
ncbi:MAG: hypothetical protein KatS3mg096_572 [Candidatus Parcubacteria bacterium]|nr:MAG: hypothetical protein KatS3mg096_572 [Candidatus Parcubacteria bacterium]